MTFRVALIAGLLTAAAAHAQITGPNNPSGYAPNMYNRSAQPLSPYLNLLRGGNNAVNYYYGVRPGTQLGGFGGMMGQMLNIQPRVTFFPGPDGPADLGNEPRPEVGLPATGHGTAFSTTMNYFGPTSGQFFSRGGSQQRRPMGMGR